MLKGEILNYLEQKAPNSSQKKKIERIILIDK